MPRATKSTSAPASASRGAIDQPGRILSGTLDINILLSFLFGVTFVVVMLVFSVAHPNPSRIAQRVFIVVLALAGAGVAAVIPGILHVKSRYIKAGGALAVFVMILTTRTEIVDTVAKLVPPSTSPAPIVEEFLKQVDSENLDASWNLLDQAAKDTHAKDRIAHTQAYKAGRYALGKVERRDEVGSEQHESPTGYPIGIYKTIVFRTKFSSGFCFPEHVTVRATSELQWRVFGHTVSPVPTPCLD